MTFVRKLDRSLLTAELAREREWLVTNGIGGYASGTISGHITRRFHGLLVASLPAPLGRVMMLNHVAEHVRLGDGSTFDLDAQERPSPTPEVRRADLVEFRLDDGLPVWTYGLGASLALEKRLVMPRGQNTVHLAYSLVRGEGDIHLELEPWVNFRPHAGALDRPVAGPYSLTATDQSYEVSSADGYPPLRLRVSAAKSSFFIEGKRIRNVHYGVEQSRGYDASGDLYTPGFFRLELAPENAASLCASTESWEVAGALSASAALASERLRRARLTAAAQEPLRVGFARELIAAADQFVITPAGRVPDATRARATGDDVRTVIAGYHWFTDWGRDTMISLEGLTLVTGRHAEAGYILRTFAQYVRDGLIPNMFPEGTNAGVYHTADASLWYYHAVDRYLAYTGDRWTLHQILPSLLSIADHHANGTRFGIVADPRDGLLTQGSPDHPLTWMDAKMGDLIVTPRRGKAVEINALYYNALCLLASWVGQLDGAAAARIFEERAATLRASFNTRFWYEPGGHLYDVIDGERGDDPALRPNQIFAISLPHAVLDPVRWASVMNKVEEVLLTPLGLRSLAPNHPDYRSTYHGDLRARDLAYHQGTVWAWLIGPFVDAWVKTHPDESDRAKRFLDAFVAHLDEACVGSISEIFDASAPYTPRGCIAQAWSVAEVLRLLARP
jgi:predicted glycogen debranching enzyme